MTKSPTKILRILFGIREIFWLKSPAKNLRIPILGEGEGWVREVKGWGECYGIVGGGMEKKCGMDSGGGIPKNLVI